MRATAITSACSNFAFAMASAVSFIFMARELGLSAPAIGVVLAIGSVAVMAGAAVVPALATRTGSARFVWLSLAVTGPIVLLGPLAQPGWTVGLFVLSLLAGELGQIVYSITNNTVRMQLCPERMLGRVTATMRVLIMGLFPLGASSAAWSARSSAPGRPCPPPACGTSRSSHHGDDLLTGARTAG